MTVRIKPKGSQWVVTQNGTTKSNHRKKSAAKRSANRVANDGEQVIEHGRGGQIIDQRRRQRRR